MGAKLTFMDAYETTQKRKLDAFDKLDSSLSISPTSYDVYAPEPPAKKTRLYSSLIFPNKKDTPHLSALLSRMNSKRRTASTPQVPPNPDMEYRPSSLSSLLSRLETYKLTTYSPKPPSLNPVEAAKCGWLNQGGKDRLVCNICSSSWIMAAMGGEGEERLVKRLKAELVNKHKDGCPWKSRQCDDSVYALTFMPPSNTVNMILRAAQHLTPCMRNVSIQHPLNASQLKTLRSKVLSAFASSDQPPVIVDSVSSFLTCPPSDAFNGEPSTEAIVAALFGWAPYVFPTTSRPATASGALSRTPSTHHSRAGAPAHNLGESVSRPGSPSPPLPPPRRGTSLSLARDSSGGPRTQHKDMIFCRLCHRRVGLWDRRNQDEVAVDQVENGQSMNHLARHDSASSSTSIPPNKTTRSLNLLLEHRPFCPYVTKETPIPSFNSPLPQSTSIFNLHHSSHARPDTSRTVEGWRAMLIIVSKARPGSGMSTVPARMDLDGDVAMQAPSTSDALSDGTGPSAPENIPEGKDEGSETANPVKRMVDVVKRRGARDVLEYLKGVLH